MTPSQKKHYDACIAKGTSPVLAEMFALAQAPNGVSDCTFMRGHDNGSQFQKNPKWGNYYKHITEKHGGNINGKRYLSGLARFPGDPEAWVGGRDDVKRVLEQRGWGSEGTVNVKAREIKEPVADPVMAPDLVNKYAAEIASRDPNPHLVDMDDLKEQVKEKMGPKKRRKAHSGEVIKGMLGN